MWNLEHPLGRSEPAETSMFFHSMTSDSGLTPYGYDGWFATSQGKTQPWSPYGLRDYRYYPKSAAHLWDDDPLLPPQLGKRIFFDQHDSTGRLAWDPQDQCGIHIPHMAKHASDYLFCAGNDVFVEGNWQKCSRS